MVSAFCEFGAGALALLGLALCWFRSKTGLAYRFAVASLIAAYLGFCLMLVPAAFEYSTRNMDRDDIIAAALYYGIPSLLSGLSFFLSRYKRRQTYKAVTPQ